MTILEPHGLTLEQYATAKALPVAFLKDEFGLGDDRFGGKHAVRIPYRREDDTIQATRFRIALDGDRFRWERGAKLCLYGLNLLRVARSSGYVVLVEGESDCHTLWHHGFPAFGVPGASTWREERDTCLFNGIGTIYVVVEPGQSGKTLLAMMSRSSIRDRIRLLRLPVKDPSALHLADPDEFKSRFRAALDDAVPWGADGAARPALNGSARVAGADNDASLAGGHPTRQEHGPRRRSNSGEESERAVLVRVADVPSRPIRWLWQNRIALGKLSLVAGHPGLGKSQFAASLAATVTTGGCWPCDEGHSPMGHVIVLSAEDDIFDTIRPRLEAAGADLARVHILTGIVGEGDERRGFDLARDMARFEEALTTIGDVALVIIDPITAYLGGTDSHRTSNVRAVLAPLAELASRHGVTVVAISHLNKAGGTEAMSRVTGSLAFVAAARAAFLIQKDAADPERRLFLPVKNNLGNDRTGLAFHIEERSIGNGLTAPAIAWDPDHVEVTADEALAAANGEADGGALAEAKELLRDLLAGGPLTAKEVQK